MANRVGGVNRPGSRAEPKPPRGCVAGRTSAAAEPNPPKEPAVWDVGFAGAPKIAVYDNLEVSLLFFLKKILVDSRRI